MAGLAALAAWVPRGPCGPWLCLLVALALDVVRGQREGRGWAGPGVARARPGPVRRDAASGELRVPGLSSERVAPQLALRTGGLTTAPPPNGSSLQSSSSVASLTSRTWQLFLIQDQPVPGSHRQPTHLPRAPPPARAFNPATPGSGAPAP